MTKPNMKPYDPAHTGEFCTRAGKPVELLKTDRVSVSGRFPLLGLTTHEGIQYVAAWTIEGRSDRSTEDGPSDLMCVIPKREARVITLNSFGDYKCPGPNLYEYANTTFREVMPDDISQEHARAVFEAARRVVSCWSDASALGHGKNIDKLRAALGDET